MSERPFLDLLLQDAPADAYEELVREAGRRGAAEAELRRLRETMATALRVRAVMAERRRREVELSALNETASDLTSIRDLGRVLQAIVRRGRHLLGTDTCYLTLIDDERGDTYMRVTDGISDRSFQRLRLPFGTGLGGLVAQTASPYATPNYFADGRFDHTSAIDDAVAREGLVAILGVPLLLGERVTGVLFAADRRERPFAPDEITLLGSLASHAAVAIENARLFQETQAAVERLNEANEVIREHSAAVQRAAESYERLTQVVLQGGDVAAVAAAIAEQFDAPAVVVDADGRAIARCPDDAGPLPGGVLDAAAQARESGRAVTMVRAGHADWWVAPVTAGARPLGTLALGREGDPEGPDARTLGRAAQTVALLLLNQRAVAEAEQRVRGEILGDLLAAPERDPDGLRQRARLQGADLDEPHIVVVADSWERHRGRVATSLASDLGGLAGGHHGDLVAIVPGTSAREIAEDVGRRLGGAGGSETVGAAGPATGPEGLAAAHAEAARCLRLLRALGRDGEVATSSDLGFYGLLLSAASAQELAEFVDRAIGEVLRYDAARRTELVATLRAYFEQRGNVTRAAEALHVHVNTLYQRLERVGALLGEDWHEPARELEIHLALRLADMRGAPPLHRAANAAPPRRHGDTLH